LFDLAEGWGARPQDGGEQIEKETLEVWVNPDTKVDVEVPLGTHKLLGDLLKTAKARAEAAKVKSG